MHRIGRTGRFGRVGVALSFVHDRNSWVALSQIADYFKVDLTPVNVSDWDAVEEMVQKIIKNPRAGRTTQEMNAAGA